MKEIFKTQELGSKKIENDPNSMDDQSLIKRTREVLKFLRHASLGQMERVERTFDKPNYFYVNGHDGEVPVFVFSSFPCAQYNQGYCTPCAYSGVERSNAKKSDVYASLTKQAQYIVDNFNELVTSHQSDIGHENLFRKYPESKFGIFQLAGEGSFFADSEIPQKYRSEMIEMFKELSEKDRINLQIFLETKATDFLKNYSSFEGKEGEEENLVHDLNLTLLFGLESSNEFTRQVIFNKGLELNDFEKSFGKAHELGFRVGAFVFCGMHSMTQKELIEDIEKTIDYCRENDLAIDLMLPNIQPFTINHLLYQYGKYNLPDPRTVLEIVKTLTHSQKRDGTSNYINGYDWNISGLATYPKPEMYLFQNRKSITCSDCSEKIEDAVRKLTVNYNIDTFNSTVHELDKCDCKKQYDEFVNHEEANKDDLRERVHQNINFAMSQKKAYIDSFKK